MYIVIRRSQSVPGKMDEVAQAVEEVELWPIVSNVPGPVEYYLVQMGDGGVSISIFETQEAAEESTRKTMDFIRQNPLAQSLMEGPYEVVVKGEVRVHKVKQS